MFLFYTFKSLASNCDAILCVKGKLYGTSLHPLVWHRWPYPTVGRPMGSGAGEATKPSNSLIRETVAALTFGPVHARRTRKGNAKVVFERRVRGMSWERYIVEVVIEEYFAEGLCLVLNVFIYICAFLRRTTKLYHSPSPSRLFSIRQVGVFDLHVSKPSRCRSSRTSSSAAFVSLG
jgi:hypothetical protein